MGDRGCQLAHRRNAVGVRELQLHLTVYAATTRGASSQKYRAVTVASETRPSKRYPASCNNAVCLLARFHTAAAAPKTCPSMCTTPFCDARSLTPCDPAASEKRRKLIGPDVRSGSH